jgi:hypothetical protein
VRAQPDQFLADVPALGDVGDLAGDPLVVQRYVAEQVRHDPLHPVPLGHEPRRGEAPVRSAPSPLDPGEPLFQVLGQPAALLLPHGDDGPGRGLRDARTSSASGRGAAAASSSTTRSMNRLSSARSTSPGRPSRSFRTAAGGRTSAPSARPPAARIAVRRVRRVRRLHPQREIDVASRQHCAQPLADLRLETVESPAQAQVQAEVAVVDRPRLGAQPTGGVTSSASPKPVMLRIMAAP